ncbi:MULTISPECIES: FAD-binding oxidoreductase [unclassified Mesorhizobium]|uniref:NAD(P)/FAD-dependent oxidoreductase n=3 Tax=Mesorhizobium TaxID=68287 RepID=UPI000FD51919|nr:MULTISPECIES: FAD-binding oxidoreductase [unclassified Mesorhizobium]RUX10353.1 FAD-binding oxidoreductase [Mesorhizobium sp. M8A.F.Ca.ET.059.01.1.1]TGP95523.1 FAD-binding oxidoreductase [Mesorhizobium sp. M8A.F.Ca.ET.218.01.1.1]TGT18577.1 FAD-binding oxidoreductase [Mesorhizobium sp. M8A.F.Ca.ET.213.01.1.1]TGT89588.1 FAD-binding oxidoreductase [Mesorhizobium sp. M8A.F.Ca.ET.161.01.1.1]TGV42146.1 FAD-binding oxidoreductase [Mesorhizobium sp. M8A.F.Ca.ET.142.01.1.1]
MRAPLQQIETSGKLPQSADVVVIGAGIVGVFAAYYMARRGLKVALVEKGRIGAEQSSRNWGWCRQQNRDARELPMATRSLDLWDSFAAETGEDTGFRRCGLLYLSNDEAELAGWARWRDFARTAGVTTHMLDGAEASEQGRATGRSWKGGVFSPTDGTADPSRAAPAVARAIVKLGSSVHQNCAARGIETEGGRLSGVVTESGTIRTKAAVMAGGAWASSFCHQFGFRFPQASVRSSILSVSPGAEGLPDALHTAKISATRRGDGGYTLAISGRGRVDVTPQQLRFSSQFVPMFLKRWRSLGPGGLQGVRSGHETLRRWRLDQPTPMERMRILDPAPDQSTIRLTHARALELLPALRRTRINAAWAGYIDSTPDGVPAIGAIHSVPGFILAAGFSGHGFGIGPGAGHLVADLVTGSEPIVDATSYDPRRFDGSVWGKVADF